MTVEKSNFIYIILCIIFIFKIKNELSCGVGDVPCSSVNFAISRLDQTKGVGVLLLCGRADLTDTVRMDDVKMMSDGIVRDVNVNLLKELRTPGYLYITKLNVSEIENIKFMLNSGGMNNSKKPFIHSEGGSRTIPVSLKSCTFTVGPNSSSSLIEYTVIEVTDGVISIVGCTFTDITLNPVLLEEAKQLEVSVVMVLNAQATIRNSVFTTIQLDVNVELLETTTKTSVCEWGLYSVIVFRNSLILMKETTLLNTYSGVAVHGGSLLIDEVNFVDVGTITNKKYPVERRLKCGMCLYYFCCVYLFVQTKMR
jgi:hypothetical protein